MQKRICVHSIFEVSNTSIKKLKNWARYILSTSELLYFSAYILGLAHGNTSSVANVLEGKITDHSYP